MNVRPRGELKRTLGKWLVDLREGAEVSQARVAAASGLDQRTLRRWETEGVPDSIVHFWQLLQSIHAEIVIAGEPRGEASPSSGDDLLDQALEEIAIVLGQLATRVSERAQQPAAATSRRRRNASR